MPSLSSSPWILVAPHSGFSKLILRIRSRTSLAIRGRPPGERDRHRQEATKPFRCNARQSRAARWLWHQGWRTSPQTACDLSVKSGRDSRKLLHSLPSHEMEPAKKIRESQELCHGSPEKFSQGVSTELVRPFFQNFKIPNWLSICLSVFHSITTSQT